MDVALLNMLSTSVAPEVSAGRKFHALAIPVGGVCGGVCVSSKAQWISQARSIQTDVLWSLWLGSYLTCVPFRREDEGNNRTDLMGGWEASLE